MSFEAELIRAATSFLFTITCDKCKKKALARSAVYTSLEAHSISELQDKLREIAPSSDHLPPGWKISKKRYICPSCYKYIKAIMEETINGHDPDSKL